MGWERWTCNRHHWRDFELPQEGSNLTCRVIGPSDVPGKVDLDDLCQKENIVSIRQNSFTVLLCLLRVNKPLSYCLMSLSANAVLNNASAPVVLRINFVLWFTWRGDKFEHDRNLISLSTFSSV